MSRLKDLYSNEIKDAMVKKFGYKNVMQIPKLDKIVINMGVGEAKENAKVLDTAIKDLETITGQKAVVTRAKKSVANFKLREGMPIGCKVTLRGEKMYEFTDRLVNLALGYSHPVEMIDPEGITTTVDGNKITVSGIDKEKVGQYAAEIREKRSPEPYKGKGIKYIDEVIRRKVGKTGKK